MRASYGVYLLGQMCDLYLSPVVSYAIWCHDKLCHKIALGLFIKIQIVDTIFGIPNWQHLQSNVTKIIYMVRPLKHFTSKMHRLSNFHYLVLKFGYKCCGSSCKKFNSGFQFQFQFQFQGLSYMIVSNRMWQKSFIGNCIVFMTIS